MRKKRTGRKKEKEIEKKRMVPRVIAKVTAVSSYQDKPVIMIAQARDGPFSQLTAAPLRLSFRTEGRCAEEQ